MGTFFPATTLSLKERQNQFVSRYKSGYEPPKWKVSYGFGGSNSMMLSQIGLELMISDLENVSTQEGFVFISGIGVPPSHELYVAVFVRNGGEALVQRLKAMAERGHAELGNGERRYSERNNLVSILVGRDGRLYLRNKEHWVASPADLDITSFGPGIEVDRVEVAVYPPASSAARSLIVQEYIGYLSTLFGKGKVHEVDIWAGKVPISASMRRMPDEIDVAELAKGIAELGGFYPETLLRRFHIALNHLPDKHFVILKGVSGTGKTKLAVDYARAVHGIKEKTGRDPFLFVCPVRSDWTDPSGLTGYPNVLSGKYSVPLFLEAVLAATHYHNIPVFVCLDELNLAPVEYYFSPVLSSMESKLDIELHSESAALEGDNGEQIAGHLPWPNNLYLIGTINTDESTHTISDKVLDRAVLIDMPSVETDGFLTHLQKNVPELNEAVELSRSLLIDLNTLLSAHKQGFGYRTIEEFVRYVAFATTKGKLSADSAMDYQVVDKLLAKVRGTERQREMLAGLTKRLTSFPEATAGLASMTEDLEKFQSFQWSR